LHSDPGLAASEYSTVLTPGPRVPHAVVLPSR
jgi:hypothetical protein